MQRIVLEFKSIKQACKKLDRDYQTVLKRMREFKMTKEEAIIKPTKFGYNKGNTQRQIGYINRPISNTVSNRDIMLELQKLQRELDYIKNKLDK